MNGQLSSSVGPKGPPSSDKETRVGYVLLEEDVTSTGRSRALKGPCGGSPKQNAGAFCFCWAEDNQFPKMGNWSVDPSREGWHTLVTDLEVSVRDTPHADRDAICACGVTGGDT